VGQRRDLARLRRRPGSPWPSDRIHGDPADLDAPDAHRGKTAVLRFALSNLKPGVAPLANAILELEIVAPNPTEYRFTNPKIGGSTAVVQLTGLHVLVKPFAVAGPGSEDANQGEPGTPSRRASLFLPCPILSPPPRCP